VVSTVARDQSAIEQAGEHLLAGTTFDVGREPSDLAVGVLGGIRQHGMLRCPTNQSCAISASVALGIEAIAANRELIPNRPEDQRITLKITFS
jgi:endonuclease YncB( thermonuclease family)